MTFCPISDRFKRSIHYYIVTFLLLSLAKPGLVDCTSENSKASANKNEATIRGFRRDMRTGLTAADLQSIIGAYNFLDLSSFPRNITDYYKGNWIMVPKFSELKKEENEPSSALPRSKKQEMNFGDDILIDIPRSFPFDFSKSSGQFLFHITNQPSSVDNIDAVQGDMSIRDGIYSTDPMERFLIQGLYFHQIGILYLIGNPMQSPILEDFFIELDTNYSLTEALDEADMRALAKLAIQPDQGEDQCFFSIILQMKPVSSDFNKLYSSLYGTENRSGNQVLNKNGEEISRPKLEMKGILRSPNCNFKLDVEASSVEFNVYFSKAVSYVIMESFASIVQIIVLLRQIEYTSSQSLASRVSLATIGMQAMLDSYLCLIHLIVAVFIETLFNAFAATAFLKFVAFSVFEMRYLLLIWKSRRPQSFSEWNSIRRELSTLYSRFYGFLFLGGISFLLFRGFFLMLVFIMYSFFIPQIICNTLRDSNRPFTLSYLLCTAIVRLSIPLYFFGCPYNFTHSEPNPKATFYLLGWMSFQVLVLLLQDYLGPRFFVPNRFLPAKYDYGRPITRAINRDELPECVICMSSVDPSLYDYMITPCDHIFHSHCLLQWLEQKMECPTCRGALPNV